MTSVFSTVRRTLALLSMTGAMSSIAAAPKPARQAQTGWTAFVSADSAFAVNVPARVDSRTVAGLVAYAAALPSGTTLNMMCKPLAKLSGTALKESLAGFRKGTIGNRPVTSEKAISRDGMTGYELVMSTDTPRALTIYSLLVANENHMCSFAAVVPTGVDDEVAARAFLASVILGN